MSSSRLTDAEIRALGWEALVETLGPAGALRFAIQTERGYGDCAGLRHRMLGSLSVDELVARMKPRGSKTGQRGRRPRG
jgi:hypothetical protein